MINWKIYDKILKVINSCTTFDHLNTAEVFSTLALNRINEKRELKRYVKYSYKSYPVNDGDFIDGLNLKQEINIIAETKRKEIHEIIRVKQGSFTL